MPLLTLVGRMRSGPPPAPDNYQPGCCPYCRTWNADIAVDGNAAVRMRCVNRHCRRVIVLTRTAYLGHTGIARRKRA